ncbi:glyoxylate/hydroxypyruvate reductase A [Formivibrio citricus]|uniref:Glyoxylate/hydroxypyruvate reductase A n=1 Tax=Formivibrio citricus TaxID=83765 RepID=A0A1I5DYG3_9NEIS|nr:glyoxylate/hydroxypyruvate reductase A [Formivibrio citricus]SFO04167.1 glyoxylate/hydroxypyruvate reductase A [Formivibrio citricus]
MLYLYSPDQQELYFRLLQEALPDREIACWPQEVDPEAVTHAAVWMPPAGFFRRFPNLQAVFVMGAGVDQMLGRDDIPEQVAIVRLTDAGMAKQMIEYCLYGVLHYQRYMDVYRQQQGAGQWLAQPTRLAGEVRVSVLGLGQLGAQVAQHLAGMGYRVTGWSRQPRAVGQVNCVHGDAALRALLPETDVLFSVLPATPETRHLLDAERLALLPKDSAIINAGRGSLIDEEALLAHLNRGHLRFVMLDVFAQEPLAADHPFWLHPRVMITPHVAADTVPEEAVSQIAANLRGLAAGEPVTGVVERCRGY